MEETPIFRALKRRKVAMKGTGLAQETNADFGTESANAIVVKRQFGAKKQTGTKFSSTTTTGHRNAIDQELEPGQTSMESEQPSGGLQNRFVGASNSIRVTNTDSYMVNFIDQAMAEKSKSDAVATTQNDDGSEEYTSASETDEDNAVTILQRNDPVNRPVPQPLSEVDLGPNSTSSNFARTAAILSGQPMQEQSAKKLRRKRPRLGRDGKPLRPRARRGPTTEDLARSALVEQVLQEHGLGTYDGDRLQSQGRGTGLDEAADEKMATEFQQQFLETVAERQQRQAQGARAKKEIGTSDGPRLGGSRSSRAKMAAAQSGGSSDKK